MGKEKNRNSKAPAAQQQSAAGQGVATGQTAAGQTPSPGMKQEYQKYVKEMTPTHSLGMQMFHAFLCGGIICCIGQVILNYYLDGMKLDKEAAATWCSISLILLSVLLTAFHLYGRIVKWGGAGALVPITGFANSVAATAIEFKKEGWVFGVGSKIFTIAGPVILYGIISSWALGVVYWIMKMMGAA